MKNFEGAPGAMGDANFSSIAFNVKGSASSPVGGSRGRVSAPSGFILSYQDHFIFAQPVARGPPKRQMALWAGMPRVEDGDDSKNTAWNHLTEIMGTPFVLDKDWMHRGREVAHQDHLYYFYDLNLQEYENLKTAARELDLPPWDCEEPFCTWTGRQGVVSQTLSALVLVSKSALGVHEVPTYKGKDITNEEKQVEVFVGDEDFWATYNN